MRWRSRGSRMDAPEPCRRARPGLLSFLPGSHRTPMSRCGWDRSCLYIGRTRDAAALSSRRPWSRILPTGAETTRCSRRAFQILRFFFFFQDFRKGRGAPLAAGPTRTSIWGRVCGWPVFEAMHGQHEKAATTYYAQRMLMNTVILPPRRPRRLSDAVRDAYWGIAAKGVCSGDCGCARAGLLRVMLDGLACDHPRSL